MGEFLGMSRTGPGRRGRLRAARWTGLESLEARLLPATLVVNTTDDDTTPDDTLSLREAIEVVDGTLASSALSPQEQALVSGDLSEADTIAFDIPATGLPVIAPTSALPEITNPVTIDGTTQPGSALVAIDGFGAGSEVDGLTVSAGNSTLSGLVIGLFGGSGIRLTAGGGDLVTGCFLGTDPRHDTGLGNTGSGVTIDDAPGNRIVSNLLTGNGQFGVLIMGTGASGNVVRGNTIGADQPSPFPMGNGLSGVYINNAPGNTIGGTDPGARNIISGNLGFGIAIGGSTATGNLVQDNYIGTDVTGQQSVANSQSGIQIFQGASHNVIGGATAGARNVISGNDGDGIAITDSASANQVQGNYIGTTADGKGAQMGLISNRSNGVAITGASGNLIGGPDPDMGNVISNNGMNGVNIFSTTDGTDTTGNVVQGNRIGTDASGTVGLGNLNSGILIATARDNLIGGTTPGAGNLLSANGQDGVDIALAATGNLIQGNEIGTDATGIREFSNGNDGVFIEGASGNTIGGTTPGAGNVISGNHMSGVHILGAAGGSTGEATSDLIQGNLIGTDPTGTQILPNLGSGVLLEGGSGDTIGGTTPAARNVISGNNGDGVMIFEAAGDVVQGNYIGLDRSGTRRLDNSGNGVIISNSKGITIGGTSSGAGNVIARNEKDGIAIVFQSTGTLVQGNIIGLDLTGTQPEANFGNGVSVDNSTATTIGGTTAGARNLISSNGGDGIKITDFSDDVLVQGNLIGTDQSGTMRLANLGNGVEVTNQAQGAMIGGATTAARNVISGNQGSGIVLALGSGVGNVVQGNFIGTDASGTQALGNALYGVLVGQSQANLIGGATAGTVNVVSNEENVISGNRLAGIFILGKSATGNVIQGNLIGTDVTGTRPIANEQGGISLGSATTLNTIGGQTPPARNVISGNLTNGVTIAGQGTSRNVIQGNDIGTDAGGMHPLRNSLSGIFVQDASSNTIGGITLGAGNVISGNGQDGITIANPSATGNVILLNLIGTDLTGQRIADDGGNSLGNGGNGISINNAPLNAIALNLISGNAVNGVSIANLAVAAGQGIAITSNIIGSDPGGTLPLGNGADGILLDTVTNEVIGGSSPADFNLISGNHQSGIEIRGGSTSDQVLGNRIGTTLSGTAPLGNQVGVTLDGVPGNTIARNLISGNSNAQGGGIGVQLLGAGASGNLVDANFIGTDASGTRPVANDTGISLDGAPGNTIADNLISGNIRPDTSGIGISISGAGATNNLVQGNEIGTDVTGTRTLVATQADLGILLSNTPGNNTIGGTTAAARNVISGFKVAIEIFAAQSQFNPTPGSTVEGNYIGTDKAGAVALGNGVGVFINGVPRNTIGGLAPGARNIISGNTIGIYLLGSTTTGNLIQGNLIGLDAAGKAPLGNYIGIFLDGASSNVIGGTMPAARNFIAGNRRNGADGSIGIYFFDKARNNVVENNAIGTDINGHSGKGLGMGDYGVLLFNAPNNSLGKSRKARNRIVGSGIAATREFTGSTSRAPATGTGAGTGTGTGTHGKTHAAKHPNGPGKFLRGRRSGT